MFEENPSANVSTKFKQIYPGVIMVKVSVQMPYFDVSCEHYFNPCGAEIRIFWKN